jgi:hypothetical protein
VIVPVEYDFESLDEPFCFNILKVSVASEGSVEKAFARFAGTISIGKNSEIRFVLRDKVVFIIKGTLSFTPTYNALVITMGNRKTLIEGKAVLDQSKSANENERDLLQFSTSTAWEEDGEQRENPSDIEFRGGLALNDNGELKFVGSFEGTNTFDLVLVGNYKLGSVGLQILSKDGDAKVLLNTRGSFTYMGSKGAWDVGLGYSKSTGVIMKAGINFESDITGPDGSAKMNGKADIIFDKGKLQMELEFDGKFELKNNRALEFVVIGKLVDGNPSFGFSGTAVVSKEGKIIWSINHDGKKTELELGYEGEKLNFSIELLKGQSGITGSFMVSYTLDLDGRQKAGVAVPLPDRGAQPALIAGSPGTGVSASLPLTDTRPTGVPTLDLESFTGKDIKDICGNGFDDPSLNHCAHFVSHVLGVDYGYDCKVHTGGKAKGSCVRVQELFEVCPQVGLFENAREAPCIVFVTEVGNVDLAAHKMRNVPQKHVGIYDGNVIYHYSNTQDKVVKQTPGDFLDRFESIYSGKQALFFGTMPLEIRVDNVPVAIPVADPVNHQASAVPLAATKPALEIREAPVGSKTAYFARERGGREFYVSSSVPYQSYIGLYQPSDKQTGPIYRPEDYFPLFGPVAALLGSIAASESGGRFNRINSYDRAAFTYGFFQLAAHTPNDNLILLFRRLAAESSRFQIHFPELAYRDGKLHRHAGGGHWVSLEREYPRTPGSSEMNLKDFMNYLNPDLSRVDKEEVDHAARLVFLATDTDANRLQVTVAAEITMGKIRKRYDVWYDLHGVSDTICTAIADIHHQGRAGKTLVKEALKAGSENRQLDALCKIGEDRYPERCSTLRKKLNEFVEGGMLGISAFDRAGGLFALK